MSSKRAIVVSTPERGHKDNKENQMLFIEATTSEQKMVIAREANAILKSCGAKKAIVKRVTKFNRSRMSITGGITYMWNENSTELAVTRWAEGRDFANSRPINAGIYQAALEAAGFITELRNKKLIIKGKAA